MEVATVSDKPPTQAAKRFERAWLIINVAPISCEYVVGRRATESLQLGKHLLRCGRSGCAFVINPVERGGWIARGLIRSESREFRSLTTGASDSGRGQRLIPFEPACPGLYLHCS